MRISASKLCPLALALGLWLALPAHPAVAAPAARANISAACLTLPEKTQRLSCLFHYGMQAKRRREHRRAIAHFRHMLAIDPTLARVRLELAQSYFLIGNDAQAERHFRYAMGNGLPPVAARKVMAYLEAIKRRRDWEVTFDFSITPQSNITTGASKCSASLGGGGGGGGGITFTSVSLDNCRKKGLAANVYAAFTWRPHLGQDVRVHVRIAPQLGALTESMPRLRDLHKTRTSRHHLYLPAELGLVFLADRQQISAGVSAARFLVDGEGYRKDLGLWVRGFREVDLRTRINASLSLTRLWYDHDIQDMGWDMSITPDVRRQVNASLAVSLATPFFLHKVKARDQGYVSVGLAPSFDLILPRDFSLYVGLQISRARYLAVDGFFGQRRRDWLLQAQVRLTWGGLSFHDLAPYVEYSYTRQDSNLKLNGVLDPYDYDNHAIKIGLSKTF